MQKDVSTFIPGPIENWKAPTKYLTFDANGNLILAMINNSETYHLVTKYQSKYFGITDPKFSPDGMYVTYLTLPKSILDEFEKEPPYEFHGSSDYELHLLNISNPSQPTDTLIAGAVAFYGLDSLPGMRWRSNTTLTYATWNTEKSIQEYHLYDIESRSLSDIVKEDNDWQTISPSGKYYSVFEKSPKTQTNPQSISGYVNLLIGDTTTGKEELVYKDFLINEADTVFIDDDHLILTREDFARQTISDCYVELITISSKRIDELDKVECPPGSSYTNIYRPTISPDGKYLVALYSEDPPNSQETERIISGSGYLYNFVTHKKKFIAKNEHWYGNVVWLSNDEILLYTSGSHGADPKEAFIYNVQTNTVRPHPTLNGKSILSII